jgi:hemolysin activation/secretion protein
MFAGVRAIATALAMVSVSFAAVAQGVPPAAQIVPPSDQPGRERERFERPAVPLAQPGGPAIAVPGIEAPAGAAETMLVVRQIRIEGATVYTSAQLTELYADLIGQKVSLQAVYDVAGRITAKYGADGSRAMSRRSNGRRSWPAIAISFPTTRPGSRRSGRSISGPSSAISCSPATCPG